MAQPTANPLAQRLCAVVLVLGVLLVYGQVVDFRFSGQTDFDEVATNASVTDGLTASGVGWIQDGTPGHRWQPLTWLLHMAVRSVDNQTTLHHAINVLLHLLNVLLVFVLLQRIAHTPYANALFAGLFAFHPLRAEAVAWVSALGEILGASCLLLALFAVTEEQRGARRHGAAALALLFALGAVLSSTRYALAPLLVPLFAAAVRRNADKDAKFTAHPALWVASSLIAVYGLVHTDLFAHMRSGEWALLGRQFQATLGGAAVLLSQFAWPIHLSIFYAERTALLWTAFGLLAIAAAIALAVGLRRRAPISAFGAAMFVLALPSLITRASVESLQIPLAETYLAVTGLVFLLAGLPALVPAEGRLPMLVKAASAAVVAALAALAALQTGHRANSFTLWRHNIAVCPECDMPYRLLGDLYAVRLNSEPAIGLYEQAIELDPDEPGHRMALVLVYWNRGDRGAAFRELDVLRAQHPDYEMARRFAEAFDR